MTLFEAVSAGVLLISGLLAMKRGLSREVVTTVVLTASVAIALLVHRLVLVRMGINAMGQLLGAIAVFAAATVILAYVSRPVFRRIAADTTLPDRLLGLLFGLARGLLLVIFGLSFVEWLLVASARPSWLIEAPTAGLVRDLGARLTAVMPDVEILLTVVFTVYLSLLASLFGALAGPRRIPPQP